MAPVPDDTKSNPTGLSRPRIRPTRSELSVRNWGFAKNTHANHIIRLKIDVSNQNPRTYVEVPNGNRRSLVEQPDPINDAVSPYSDVIRNFENPNTEYDPMYTFLPEGKNGNRQSVIEKPCLDSWQSVFLSCVCSFGHTKCAETLFRV
eukprot:837266_1